MSRTPTRLAAGALALVLPLGAVAACGAEKKKTVKAEFESAQQYLEDSKSAAFSFSLRDAQGNLAKAASKAASKGDDAMPKALADALLGGSITYVVDPTGDRTLGQVSTDTTDLSAALKDTNVAFVVKDDKATLGEIRLVDGVLFARVDLAEVKRLAELGGTDDVDAQLDDATTDGPPELKQVVADVRAGKWVKLDVTKFTDQIKDLTDGLAEGFGATPAPTPSKAEFDASALGHRLFDAVKPYVTVTDANDSSRDRVLDIKVKVRPALKAALKVLSATDDLPFPNVFADVMPSEIDKNVADGTATGQIRLADSHLTQVSVDLEPLRTLSTDPGEDSFAGSSVVFGIDDEAGEVKAPTDVSSVDLGSLFQDFLDSVSGATEGEESFSYAG